MSLINDMLRDLEQRREQDKHQEPVSSPAAVVKKISRQKKILVAGVLMLLVVTLLVVGRAYYLPRKAAPSLSLVAVADLPAAPTGTLPVELKTPTSVPLPAINPLLTAMSLIEEGQQLQLELTFDHLPDHAEIRSMPREGRILIRLPETHLQQGLVIPQPRHEQISNISLMPTSAGLDLVVAVAPGQQIPTSQRLDSSGSRLFVGLEFPLTTSVPDEVPADPIAGSVQAVAALPSETVATTTVASVSPQPVLPTLVRTPPLPETGEQLYQRGLFQLRQGHLRAAQGHLAAALRINPELLTARLELIGVLQQQAEGQQAFQVIQEGLQLHPAQPELRKLVAHYLLYQQRHQEALTQLEIPPVPAVAADPDYHALRAAIYQEFGDYARSAQLYAQLLEQRSAEPLWWLGLAIALEQQGLAGGARDAYRTALDVSGLRPDLEQFVRERLQYL